MDAPKTLEADGLPRRLDEVAPAGGGLVARIARTARFIKRNRLYKLRYVMMALRFVWFKIRNPHILTDGFFFLERGAEVYARKGYGRLRIGRWVWVGTGNALRCHEGNLTIGDKCVFGRKNTINAYMDVTIGADCIFADWIYITDFDHKFDDLSMPIRKQGIVKSPVKIGEDCWFGEKTTVLRGVTVGRGCVIASHALVNRDLPPLSVAGGVPARVLKSRAHGQKKA
ncbi:MAG TPA: acyltransferase [Actinomycetota bacterium]|nr:acyltransferase [Actinomycetota bacterium]